MKDQKSSKTENTEISPRKYAKDEIVFASGVGGARDVPEFVYPSILVPEESKHAYAIARHGVSREQRGRLHLSSMQTGAAKPRNSLSPVRAALAFIGLAAIAIIAVIAANR